MLLRGIVILGLSTLVGCGSKSSDSEPEASTLKYGGKGNQAIEDGSYKLDSAAYSDGKATTAYVLSSNTLKYKVTWLSEKSLYQVELTGSAVYSYTGGSSKSGCTTGSRVSQFKLDDSNNIVNDTRVSDCTQSAEASSGSSVKNTADNLFKTGTGGITRTTTSVVDGSIYTYSFTFTKE